MSSAERVAYWLLKEVNRAIREHDMLRAGDRVAVGVSGGKDSLALLRLLELRRRSAPEPFELAAIHVLGDASGADMPLHPPLAAWLEQHGVALHVERMQLGEGEQPPISCQRCARNRRRTLFHAARELGCNVLALGHHADDLAETTLMNLVHNGRVETMAPVRDYFAGAFRLIRPLCYLRESEIRRLARAAEFPEPPPVCPLGERTARAGAGEMLRLAKRASPNAVPNLLRAGLRGLSADGFSLDQAGSELE